VDLAFVFSEFDRKPYDRALIEKRLSQISPRASSVARDPSKFRDEISAYPAYLGLYKVELVDEQWHFVLSETAKKFLIVEEPNVPAFMLLQLILFQYPNGMGVVYSSTSNNVRIQANSRDRTLEFIDSNIHLSPIRLICKAIQGNAIIDSESVFNIAVKYEEIFALCNDTRINIYPNPPIDLIVKVIKEFRDGKVKAPKRFESRFHILKHTDFLIPEKSGVRLRNSLNALDKLELTEKFNTILKLDHSYDGFDNSSRSNEILDSIVDGSWGRYFDGVRTLNSDDVDILTSEKGILENLDIEFRNAADSATNFIPSPMTYSFRKRNHDTTVYSTYSFPKKSTDPEITRIRRQKSNLNHKIILQQLEDYLELKGCEPMETDHIDLFAKIPGNGKYLFEVKSLSDDNLLSQARKGISQLYEYRYRYQSEIGYDVSLCLVLPRKPIEIDWLEDYLSQDREIGVIWFDDQGKLGYPIQGKELISSLI
jgi:hypothetical protein